VDLNLKEIKKIVELLRKLQPNTSEEELNKQSENLYQLGLFWIRLKIKNSQSPKQKDLGVLEGIKKEPP